MELPGRRTPARAARSPWRRPRRTRGAQPLARGARGRRLHVDRGGGASHVLATLRGPPKLCQNCARTIGNRPPSTVAIGRGGFSEVGRSQHIVPDRDTWSRCWGSIQLPIRVVERDGGGEGGRPIVATSG